MATLQLNSISHKNNSAEQTVLIFSAQASCLAKKVKNLLLWVPCFMHRTHTGHFFTYVNVYVSVLFSQIIPPSPSEVGGGVQDLGDMYTYVQFMLTYGKNHHNIVK